MIKCMDISVISYFFSLFVMLIAAAWMFFMTWQYNKEAKSYAGLSERLRKQYTEHIKESKEGYEWARQQMLETKKGYEEMIKEQRHDLSEGDYMP